MFARNTTESSMFHAIARPRDAVGLMIRPDISPIGSYAQLKRIGSAQMRYLSTSVPRLPVMLLFSRDS